MQTRTFSFFHRYILHYKSYCTKPIRVFFLNLLKIKHVFFSQKDVNRPLQANVLKVWSVLLLKSFPLRLLIVSPLHVDSGILQKAHFGSCGNSRTFQRAPVCQSLHSQLSLGCGAVRALPEKQIMCVFYFRSVRSRAQPCSPEKAETSVVSAEPSWGPPLRRWGTACTSQSPCSTNPAPPIGCEPRP